MHEGQPFRLPTDKDGNDREWTNEEKYMLFRRGYRDAASHKPTRKEDELTRWYSRGYAEAIEDRALSTSRFCRAIGYEPSILRACADAEEENDQG